MKKWFYELIYSFIPVDWVFGSSSKIENFVDMTVDGRIEPGRAITLGCGVGRESIHLAKKGFDVVGLDFSPTAIQRARHRAEAAGVDVRFIVDDLTNPQHLSGKFDLVTDFGVLNDLGQEARDKYMQNVIPLTYPGSKFAMFCFDRMLPSDEVKQRFGQDFEIEIIHKSPGNGFPGRLILYLMTRNH